MTRDDATGVWSVTGTAAWKNQFYLYDVEVFAPSTGQVEHNLVTDPYSLALAEQLHAHPDRQPVRRRAPAGRLGRRYTKPGAGSPGRHLALRAPRPRLLHQRRDACRPRERGTYAAFTRTTADWDASPAALANAGLTHVHLLPVFDIATVDERPRRRRPGPTCDLADAARRDSGGAAGAASRAARPGRLQLGLRPVALHGARGQLRDRSRRRGARSSSSARWSSRCNDDRAAGRHGRRLQPHDGRRPGPRSRCSIGSCPATTTGSTTTARSTNSTCCENTATEHAMMEKLMVDSIVHVGDATTRSMASAST